MAVSEPLVDDNGPIVGKGTTPASDSAHDVTAQDMAVRPTKRYRGSASQIRRLEWWTHTPPGIWILFALALSAAFITLACLATFS